ncbi:MAG: PepSY-like domain-containing protein [Bacteroidota bacterium]
MKKLVVLLSVCMLFSLLGFAQTITPDKVPAAVKEAFAKKFPVATGVKYEMEKNDYEVTFKEKGIGMSANFNSSGEWLETETIMIESDLPKDVLTSAATNFAGFVMTEITRVEGPDNVLNYEMNLKKNKEFYEVKFSPKGEILKKTPLKK